MPINMTDPNIITLGNRRTSFDWLYLNVSSKLPDYALPANLQSISSKLLRVLTKSKLGPLFRPRWSNKISLKSFERWESPKISSITNWFVDRFNRHQTGNNTKITVINFILPHNAIWLQPILNLIFRFNFGGRRFEICNLDWPETISI